MRERRVVGRGGSISANGHFMLWISLDNPVGVDRAGASAILVLGSGCDTVSDGWQFKSTCNDEQVDPADILK